MKYLLGLFLICVSCVSSADIFYKVEHADKVHEPAYLFGTMHVLCSSNITVPAAVKSALAGSSQLIVEVDLQDPYQQQTMMQQMHQNPSNYLKEHLTQQQYLTLAGAFQKETGFALDAVKTLRPILLSAMLMRNYLNCADDLLALDEYLTVEAAKANKSIVGLETIQQQFELFDAIPLEEQVSELLDMAVNRAEAQQELQTLSEAYLATDAQQIFSLMQAQDSLSDFQTLLLDQRNERWLEVIPELIAKQPSLIVVGAGHLAGDKGLVTLLRNAGYQVTPVTIRFR